MRHAPETHAAETTRHTEVITFKLPTHEQLKKVGAEMGMDVPPDYAQSVIEFLKRFAEGYRLIAALGDELPPVRYPRGAFYRPEGDENKYGAWAVKTSIKGAESGTLAGKTAAIKDTYCVAGMPLTNGADARSGPRKASGSASSRKASASTTRTPTSTIACARRRRSWAHWAAR
jgi:hypothetical protein